MLAARNGAALGRLAVAIAFLIGRVASAQGAGASWKIAPRPEWVQDVALPDDTRWLEDAAPAGCAIVLMDSQIRLVDGRAFRFARVVERITSETGVRDAGQRQFTFRPPYEELVLHDLSVRRGDRTVSSLEPESVQVMQREPELESGNVYAGALTALVVLHDLRVGDVIESSHSVAGSNPVLEGHFDTALPLDALLPLGAVSYRIVSDRALHVRRFAGAIRAHESRIGDLREYSWRRDRIDAVDVPLFVPPEHDIGPWVQLSDIDDWADVVAWGRRVFELPEPSPPSVRALAAEIAGADRDRERRLLAALRRVQDDVRYFALALAENSHRPFAPDVVLERRFGDCKDKSLLLVALLRELGFEAHVALVSSDGGRDLPRVLPAIGVFDHAIVVTEFGKRLVWLDPTRMFQRGSVANVAVHDYRQALVLSPGSRALTAIAAPRSDRPSLRSRAQYRIARWGGAVELELVDVFHGQNAEGLRAVRANATENELRTHFAASVRMVHDDATLRGALQFEDRESENEIVVTQRYLLANPWERATDGQLTLPLQPFALVESVVPVEPDRAAPLALGGGGTVVQDTTVELPEPIAISSGTYSLRRGPVAFQSRSTCTGTTLSLHHRLEWTSERVEVEDLDDYRSAIDEMEQHVTFELLSSSEAGSGAGTFNWLVFGIALFWSVIVLAASVVVLRVQPWWPRPHVPWTPELVGLRGWLVLLGLGTLLSPLLIAIDVWSLLPAFGVEAWHALSDPSSASYDARSAPIVLSVLLGDVAQFWASLLLLLLFFRRSRSWPLAFVVVTGGACVLKWVSAGLLGLLPDEVWEPDDTPFAASVLSVVPTLLWIAYALQSRRVRSTFLPPPAAQVEALDAAGTPSMDVARIAIDDAAR